MNGNEFEAALWKAQQEVDEFPAVKKSEFSEEWTNLAGTRERKVWMDVKTYKDEIGRHFNITIRGLFERINPLKYEAIIEDNKIHIYEEDEQLRMLCPTIFRTSSGNYEFTKLSCDVGSMEVVVKACNDMAILFVAEIPTNKMEIEYFFQIQTTRTTQQ